MVCKLNLTLKQWRGEGKKRDYHHVLHHQAYQGVESGNSCYFNMWKNQRFVFPVAQNSLYPQLDLPLHQMYYDIKNEYYDITSVIITTTFCYTYLGLLISNGSLHCAGDH